MTIPTTYKLAPYSKTDHSVYQDIPAYTGTDETLTIKVLIAEVKKYNVSAVKYQNRQDLTEQPNPIGKAKTTIEALGEYWKVNGLSTNFSAIVGQEIDFKDVGQFTDTYVAGSRVGDLKYFGMYDASGNFVETSKFVVPAGLTGTVNLASFYAVDDLDTPAVKPSYSSSMTSGAGVGFIGDELTWKSEKVTELLSVSDSANYQKPGAYPFQLAEDPFDNPEYQSDYWTPENFALGHKIELTYYYCKIGNYASAYTVNFESNGGSSVQGIGAVEEGTKIISPEASTYSGYTFDGWYKEATLENKWDFDNDVVNADITLYAKWILNNDNQENNNNNGTTPSENNNGKNLGSSTTNYSKPGSLINLPKTGNNTILGSGLVLLLGGSIIAIGGLIVLKKRREYNK